MINKTTAKQRTLLVLLSALIFAVQCGKKEADAPQADADLRYARYAIALYSKAGSTAKGDYVTTLTKTEKVEVEDKANVDGPKGPVAYIKVRAAGDKVGFAEERHFATEVAVVLSDSPKLLQRPVVTAGKGFNADALKQGTIAFIEGRSEEAETWFEISGTAAAGHFRGWIRASEVSRDFTTVTDAVLLEKAIAQFQSDKQSEKDEGRKALEELSTNNNASIAGLAAKALEAPKADEEKEEREEPAAPETPSAPVKPPAG